MNIAAAASESHSSGRRMTLKHARRYALVLVAGLLLAVAASAGHGPSASAAGSLTGNCSPDSSWPAQDGSLSSQVLSLINQHRAAMGLGQLVASPTLTASAVWKARHMAAYGYMAHDDPAPPVARTAGARISACGYPSAGWGENIAQGFATAQSVVTAWLNSPGHKANIENPSFVSTGVGAATSGSYGTLWAQDFGTVADGGSPPPTTTTQTTAPGPTTTTAPTTTTTSTTPVPATTTAPSPTRTAAGAPAPLALALSSPGVHVKPHRLSLVSRVALAQPPAKGTPVAVKCSASAGGRHLRVVVNAFAGEAAHCEWRVPAALHGKVVRGWVRVQLAGVHVRRRFSAAL
jgi:uncharacterized protein YkwD